MEAILLMGLQGAGKSTFYRERFFDTHVRINLDMLRTRHRERLMTCGFRVLYGYTQSDEISLLLHLGEETFEREGMNQKTGEPTLTTCRRLRRELDLPMKDAYTAFITGILATRDEETHAD